MDEQLRRSAAHVLVDDVASPKLDQASDHHVRTVLRLRRDAVITVTDGVGSWRPCRLMRDGLEPTTEMMRVSRWQPSLTVAVAPPKRAAEWLVQKCAEIGIDRIVLMEADRSVVRWDPERAASHLERLRRIASEAAAQSRRVWWPTVEGPNPAADVLVGAVVAEPGGRAVEAGDVTVAIGPEGGWTDGELSLAAAEVALGPHVLRVETAAVVAAALMVARREGGRP